MNRTNGEKDISPSFSDGLQMVQRRNTLNETVRMMNLCWWYWNGDDSAPMSKEDKENGI